MVKGMVNKDTNVLNASMYLRTKEETEEPIVF